MSSYPAPIDARLRAIGAQEGDTVLVTVGERVIEGRVMPHHGASAMRILTLKLSSGYNIGVQLDEHARLLLLRKADAPFRPTRVLSARPGLRLVAFLGTGGTIASYVDYRTGAVHPARSVEDLVFSVPEIETLCTPRARVVFQVFSEDLRPSHWQQLAQEVVREFDGGAAGVVIPHGTDTLGYTAAALSFMLPQLCGPVVFVGAQRSSDRPSSDAPENLLGAVHGALSGVGEVLVAMHRTSSDGDIALHRGSRVRKSHSSRRDAFRSPNEEPLGSVNEGTTRFNAPTRPAVDGPQQALTRLEERVALVWYHPGIRPEEFAHALRSNRGVVIAGTGLGHVGSHLLELVRSAVAGGCIVGMTTQCMSGSVDLDVYATGRDLVAAGVLPLGDLLPETATIKMMWVLGNLEGAQAQRQALATDLVGELGTSRPYLSYDRAGSADVARPQVSR